MTVKKIITLTVGVCALLFVLSFASCLFGAEAAPIPSDVVPVPAPQQQPAPKISKETAEKDKELEQQLNRLFEGRRDKGQDGEKGLKRLDVPELPSPFGLAAGLVSFLFQLLWFVIQLIIIALVVWIIIRAVNRKQETGTFIPAADEETLFDRFDAAVTKLKERRAAAEAESAEIAKRLPKGEK